MQNTYGVRDSCRILWDVHKHIQGPQNLSESGKDKIPLPLLSLSSSVLPYHPSLPFRYIYAS